MKPRHEPSTRELRQFGYLCVVMLPLVGWLWGAGQVVIGGLVATGLVMAGLATLAPRWLKPIFTALVWITKPIGIVVGEIALAVIYYAVICPLGIWFRLRGRDALQRSWDRDTETYWQPKTPPGDAASYYRQF